MENSLNYSPVPVDVFGQDCADMVKQLQAERKDDQQKMKALEAENSRLAGTVANLEAEMEGRKTEAEQRHSQLGQEINGLKLKVANLEEERKTEVEQLQAAEAKAAEAEAKAAELQVNLDRIKERDRMQKMALQTVQQSNQATLEVVRDTLVNSQSRSDPDLVWDPDSHQDPNSPVKSLKRKL